MSRLYVLLSSLALAACAEAPVGAVGTDAPEPAPCPQPRGAIVLEVKPIPPKDCVVTLRGPDGQRHRIEGCSSTTMVEAGNWTATLHVQGQRPQTALMVAEPDVLSRHRFRYKPRGSVALNGGVAAGSLTTIDGKEVRAVHGTVPPGVYKLPGEDDRHAIVSSGRCSVVPKVPVEGQARGAIVVAGERFLLDDDVRVVGFDQPGGLSFHKPRPKRAAKLYADRSFKDSTGYVSEADPKSLREVRSFVTMAILHMDLANDATTSYQKLVEQETSTHFFIDFDGTIYQAMDLAYQAFHSGDTNPLSIGIDLNNLAGIIRKDEAVPPPYPPGHPRAAEMAKHPRAKTERVKINGARLTTWGYTDAQMRSLKTLLRALVAIFPKIEPTVPKNSDGQPRWTGLGSPLSARGILGHLHVSPTRWDPGPGMDWLGLEAAVRGPGDCWELPLAIPQADGAPSADAGDSGSRAEP